MDTHVARTSQHLDMLEPFRLDDFKLFQSLDDLHCVAASELAAFTVRSVNDAADGYRCGIWIADLERGTVRAFTRGTDSDNSPRWSPDGTQLAFLATREDGVPQVNLIARDGGEARQASRTEEGVAWIQWHPDGRSILMACATSVDPEARGEGQSRRKPRLVGAPEVAWRLPYKSDGIGYLLGREVHLMVLDLATGNHVQVTDGAFDVLSSCWSPDGTSICYARTREAREAHRSDLWVMDALGTNARQLTSEVATTQSPAWSPDGRWIVFAGSCAEGDPQVRLWSIDVASGECRQLVHDDLEVVASSSIHWSPDSASVNVIVAHEGCQRIVNVAVPGGEVRVLVAGERHIGSFGFSASRLAFLSESLTAPRELHVARRDGSDQRPLTYLNAWWESRTAIDPVARRFEVPDGNGGTESIQGWYLRPAGAEGVLPLLLDVHGGPTSYAMLGFPWHAYWNVLLSRGWSVLALHPVGSSSFGRDFAERLNGHWGELDFPQQVAAVESLQREGLADQRLAIAGKSYGGYLSAWAIGHTTVFRAAIVAAPVANIESHFGTSDGGYYSDPYTLRGERHVERERFRELSPIQHAHRAQTATLILQGKDDERCPRGQAEELFATLLRCGKAATEMVLYPGGDHHFYEQGKPSHRLDALTRIVGWLERWIDTPAEAPIDRNARRGDASV